MLNNLDGVRKVCREKLGREPEGEELEVAAEAFNGVIRAFLDEEEMEDRLYLYDNNPESYCLKMSVADGLTCFSPLIIQTTKKRIPEIKLLETDVDRLLPLYTRDIYAHLGVSTKYKIKKTTVQDVISYCERNCIKQIIINDSFYRCVFDVNELKEDIRLLDEYKSAFQDRLEEEFTADDLFPLVLLALMGCNLNIVLDDGSEWCGTIEEYTMTDSSAGNLDREAASVKIGFRVDEDVLLPVWLQEIKYLKCLED